MRWMSANASSVTPMNVGTISARRRRMKPSMDYPSPASLALGTLSPHAGRGSG
jgi:hypothetical protein